MFVIRGPTKTLTFTCENLPTQSSEGINALLLPFVPIDAIIAIFGAVVARVSTRRDALIAIMKTVLVRCDFFIKYRCHYCHLSPPWMP